MTAKYKPESTGTIRFDFNRAENGETKSVPFSAQLIGESGMTLAAQMRLSSAISNRDSIGITAARISGRLRQVSIGGASQKITHDTIIAWLESEDDETQEFVTELFKKFSEAVGVGGAVADSEGGHEKN